MREHQPTPPGPSWTGHTIGDFQVLRQLGAGGMARVYLAQQGSLDRQVALKILHPQLAADPNYVRRFGHEARAAAALVHPNIVQIYEVGEQQGVHFIAQEYVPGQNLAQVLQRQGAVEPNFLLDMLRQVALALGKAETLGIIHRDLKPENILLGTAGEVKIADFGLARMTHSDANPHTQVGVAMGTPLYMSPEQIAGRAVDVRSDLYALGVTSYHLLAGHPPFTGDTALAVAVQHLQGVAEPLEKIRPDVPRGMAHLVQQMLAKNPAERPDGPQDLLRAVDCLAAEAAPTGGAPPPEVAARTQEPARQRGQVVVRRWPLIRRPGVRWVGGLIAAVCLGAAGGVLTRPHFLLADFPSGGVPRQPSAAAQLWHAKQVDTAAAWLAAIADDRSDPVLEREARKGLVRCYLLVLQEDHQALQQLRHLQHQANWENDSLRGFVLAGLCIAHQRLGNRDAALAANQQLDARLRERLRATESQLYDLLQSALEHLLR